MSQPTAPAAAAAEPATAGAAGAAGAAGTGVNSSSTTSTGKVRQQGRFTVSVMGRTPLRGAASHSHHSHSHSHAPPAPITLLLPEGTPLAPRSGDAVQPQTVVAGVETRLYRLPERTQPPSAPASELVVCTLRTSAGVDGLGFVCVPVKGGTAVAALVDEVASSLLGLNVYATESAWQAMFQTLKRLGRGGLMALAVAVMDIALWDAKAKLLKLPLWQLLGGQQGDRVRCYATIGSSEEDLDEDEQSMMKRAFAAGYFAFKLRIGRQALEQETERINMIRQATEEQGIIMLDAGTEATANDIGRAARNLAASDVLWVEAPLHVCQRLTGTSPIAIASGKSINDVVDLRVALEGRAIDFPQVDVGAVGGITGWLKCANLCAAFQLNISAAGYLDGLHAHLLAAVPNADWLEVNICHPLQGFLTSSGTQKAGFCELGTAPGHGLQLDVNKLQAYLVDREHARTELQAAV